MAITVSIISASNGSAFETALQNAIASGANPVGDAWSDDTLSYQKILTYDMRELLYNPDYLSKSYRAKQQIIDMYPTSSILATSESQYYYGE